MQESATALGIIQRFPASVKSFKGAIDNACEQELASNYQGDLTRKCARFTTVSLDAGILRIDFQLTGRDGGVKNLSKSACKSYLKSQLGCK